MTKSGQRQLGDLLVLAHKWLDEAYSRVSEHDDAFAVVTRDYNTATAALTSLEGRVGHYSYNEEGNDRGVDLAGITGLKPEGAARKPERGPVEGNALVGKDQPQK